MARAPVDAAPFPADGLALLNRVISLLKLREPLPPYGLALIRGRVQQMVRTPVPATIDPVLLPPVPLPYDLDTRLVVQAFPEATRDGIRAQILTGYEHIHRLEGDTEDASAGSTNAPDGISLQLGIPIVGPDSALIRIRTENKYTDTRGQLVPIVGDFHCWLDEAGNVLEQPSESQRQLGPMWPHWVPGRSPGLPRRVDLNGAKKENLRHLPQLTKAQINTIVAARPLKSMEQLATLKGFGPQTIERLQDWVTIGGESP